MLLIFFQECPIPLQNSSRLYQACHYTRVWLYPTFFNFSFFFFSFLERWKYFPIFLFFFFSISFCDCREINHFDFLFLQNSTKWSIWISMSYTILVCAYTTGLHGENKATCTVSSDLNSSCSHTLYIIYFL